MYGCRHSFERESRTKRHFRICQRRDTERQYRITSKEFCISRAKQRIAFYIWRDLHNEPDASNRRDPSDRSWAQRNRLRSLETGQLIPLLCTIYVLCSCILPSYCFLLSRGKERKDVRRGERRLENRRTCRSEKIVSEIKWKEKEKLPRLDGWVRTLETTCAYGHV